MTPSSNAVVTLRQGLHQLVERPAEFIDSFVLNLAPHIVDADFQFRGPTSGDSMIGSNSNDLNRASSITGHSLGYASHQEPVHAFSSMGADDD